MRSLRLPQMRASPPKVLPDAHDEGVETVWLVLSNPQGAVIGRGESYGQIHNDGPIPKAWNARFGRTVATQVIDAIEDRMRGGRRVDADQPVPVGAPRAVERP